MPLAPGYGETPLPHDELAALHPSVLDILGEPVTRAAVYDLEQGIQDQVAEGLITAAIDGSLISSTLRRKVLWRSSTTGMSTRLDISSCSVGSISIATPMSLRDSSVFSRSSPEHCLQRRGEHELVCAQSRLGIRHIRVGNCSSCRRAAAPT